MRARGPGFAAPFETKYVHFLGPQEFCRDARPLRRIFVLDRSSEVLDLPIRGNDKLASSAGTPSWSTWRRDSGSWRVTSGAGSSLRKARQFAGSGGLPEIL